MRGLRASMISIGKRRSGSVSIRGTGRGAGAIVGVAAVPARCAVFGSSSTQAGGGHLAFLFISRSAPLLPVLPFPYLRGSYRFRLLWRRGVGRIVGGRRCGLAFRSSVPFYLSVPFLRLVRFPSYRIEAWQGAPFLSARFLALSVSGGSVSFSLTRYARLFVSSLFSSLRLVWRLVSILCGSLVGSSRLPINSPAIRCPVSSGGPVSRLVHRSSVFRLARLIVLFSFARLVRSVSSSNPYSLVSPERLVSAVRGVSCALCPSSRSLLFSSYPSVASHGHGGGSSFSSRCGVFPSPLPRRGIRLCDDGDVMGVPFDDTRDAPFYSARFPHRGDDGAIWNRAAGEENAMRRYGAI